MKRGIYYFLTLVLAISQCIIFNEVHAENNNQTFYTYMELSDEDGYLVGLSDQFKEQLNKKVNGVFTGKDAEGKELTWKTGEALPNPAPNGMYKDKKVVNMESLFEDCKNIVKLDLSKFNTSNVTSMFNMFNSCSSLTSLDLSSFNTENVTSMTQMFTGCSNLANLDICNFNTSKVTSMESMFGDCKSLTQLDITKFDTSHVEYMGTMFYGCSGLTSLDFSQFDTSHVKSMAYMFFGCSSLNTLDLSHFNTEEVTDMSDMFDNCSNLKSLNVNGFNTSKVESMSGMFYGCSNLQSIDLSSFNTTSLKEYFSLIAMFENACSKNDTGKPIIGYAKDQATANLFNDQEKTNIDLNKLKFIAKGSITEITLDHSTIAINVDETAKLVVTISPSDVSVKSITWSTSNSNVATVDTDGNVRGIAKGNAIITAICNDDPTKKARCTITVNEVIKEENQSNNQNNKATNKEPEPILDILPSNYISTNKKNNTSEKKSVPATSSDSNIKINRTDPLKKVTLLINAITKSMSKIKSNKNLKGSVYRKLQLKASKATKSSITIKWNKVSNTFKYLVYGAEIDNRYKLLNSTSSKSYNCMKLKKGVYYKYIIIAINKDGKKLSTSKTVIVTTKAGKTNNPTSIKLNKYKVSLKKKKRFTIKTKVNGRKLKIYNKEAYESSNSKIASVSNKGRITAKSRGTATIYVYTQNGIKKTVIATIK